MNKDDQSRELSEQVQAASITVRDYLQRAIPAAESLERGLRFGTHDPETVVQLVDALHFLSSYAQSVANTDSGTDPETQQCARVFHKRIHSMFPETLAAVESNDFLLLADLLEYEILPAIRSLQDCVSSLFSPPTVH